MSATVTGADQCSIAHYWDHGWMRIAGAFSAGQAEAMRDVIWAALAPLGIDRADQASWTVERPAQLQRLRSDPVFAGVGSDALRAAIGAALDGRSYEAPKDWGSHFIAFPSQEAWEIPTGGWHCDAHYLGPLRPAGGVKTLALLGDVAPGAGATLMLSGSHRLIHNWFAVHPPPPGARSAEMRKALLAHPYLRALHEPGVHASRIERFMAQAESVDGIPLQVIEMTGAAGDVFLLHPLLLHMATRNAGAAPRFLLSGGVTLDQWGWEQAP